MSPTPRGGRAALRRASRVADGRCVVPPARRPWLARRSRWPARRSSTRSPCARRPRIERRVPRRSSPAASPRRCASRPTPPARGRVRLRQPSPPDLALEPARGGRHARRHAHAAAPRPPHARRRRRCAPRARCGSAAGTTSAASEHEVLVYPDLPAARRLALAVRQGRFREPGRLTRGPLGLGTDFESIRDYSPDDDVRQINWRATDRIGRPMSNQFRVEQDREVMLLIDAGRLMAAPLERPHPARRRRRRRRRRRAGGRRGRRPLRRRRLRRRDPPPPAARGARGGDARRARAVRPRAARRSTATTSSPSGPSRAPSAR